MCKTTTQSNPTVADLSRKVYTACSKGGGGKTVFIRIFDEKRMMDLTSSFLDGEIFPELESFFNELDATDGIPQAAKEILKTYSFKVIYEDRASTEAERQKFGVMDFPVYLESTEGPTALTNSEAEELLESHKLPGLTYTFLIKLENGQEELKHEPADVYGSLKAFLGDSSKIGIGIPGNFLDNDQTLCRKIAIVLIDRLIANPDIALSIRRKMFVAILKHEIGHMFGLTHEQNTIMHGSYQVGPLITNPTYTNFQLKIISLALTKLSNN